ncbi:MAG TPA: hypothetical protein VLT57_09360 [Bryobacteraceae bacterium]|nr:hypothetical protein [Bryobacteraceae bacterium]
MTEHKRLSSKTRTLTLVVVFTQALGNFALAWGMKHLPPAFTFTPLSLLKVIFNPWIALGITLLILWMLSRMALLSWADLSYVLPVTAGGYILSALIGKWFLAEQISGTRWAGTLLIVAGIVLVGLTQHNTTKPVEVHQESAEPVEMLS